MSLGQSMYGVYKNPQCNWECCLSVILSAQDTSPNLQDRAGDWAHSVKDGIMSFYIVTKNGQVPCPPLNPAWVLINSLQTSREQRWCVMAMGNNVRLSASK